MASEWKSAEDLEKDMWLFSEIGPLEADTNEPTPESILQWNARIGTNNNSIFDTDLPYEDVTYLPCGRGRGLGRGVSMKAIKSKLYFNDEDDIKRRLREVSGLGYSNELIEERFKKIVTPLPIIPRDKEFCDIPEEHDTAFSKTSVKLPSISPATFNSIKSGSSRNSTPSISSTTPSPVKDKETESMARPPPLSHILRRGKEKTLNTPKENTTKNDASLKLNKDDDEAKKNNVLRPEAPEFKYTPTSSIETIKDTASATQSSNQAPINRHKQNRLVDSSSSGEELSWRRRDDNQRSEPLPWRYREFSKNDVSSNASSSKLNKDNTFRSGFLWRNGREEVSSDGERSSDLNSDSDSSYRQAALSWRDKRNDKVFDIKSDNDFPTLH